MANTGSTYLPGGGQSKVPQYFGIYLAYIAVNQDPLGQGRAKLRVPQVFGSSTSGWADPVVPLEYVPTVGTAVAAMFLGGDARRPVYLGNLAVPVTPGGTKVTVASAAPADPRIGDVWIDTTGDTYQMSEWNGEAWVYYTIGSNALADGAVDNSKLAPGAVGQTSLQDSAVGLNQIDTTDVTARTLGGNVVTVGPDEPSNPIQGDTWITTDGTGDVNSIQSYDGTSWDESTIAIGTSGGIEITASTTEPSSPNQGDMWINESENNLLEQWDGHEWNPYQFGAGAIADGAVGTDQLDSGVTTSITTAQSTADSASTAAGNAQTTADDANTAAGNAQSTADDASSAASAAQSTADDANTAAGQAQSTAQSAQTTATGAATTAGQALTTAQSKAQVYQSAGVPGSAATGDVWIKVNSAGTSVTGIYTCTTSYTSGGTTADWTSETLSARALGAPYTYMQSSTPNTANNASNPPQANDLWINTSNGNALEQYNGTTWASVQDTAIATAQTTATNAAATASDAATTAGEANDTAGNALAAANSKSAVTFSATAPDDPNTGDVWVQLDDNGNQVGSYQFGPNTDIAPQYAGDAELTAAATSIQIPVSSDVPEGSTIVVAMNTGNTTSQTVTVADTQGNAYTSLLTQAGTSTQLFAFAAPDAASLSGSDLITVTTTHSQFMSAAVFAVPGAYAVAGTTGAGGAGTSASVTTSSSGSAGNAVLAVFANGSNQTAGTPASYTSIGHYAPVSSTSTSLAIDAFFQTATAGGAQTVASTYPASANWAACAVTVSYASMSWNLNTLIDASAMIAASTITADQIAAGSITSDALAANSVTADQISAGAIDGKTINAPIINGGQISASDFILEPGSANYIASYGTPPTTTITLLGNGSWPVPAGVTSFLHEFYAGGGGGGGGAATNTTTYMGGGGGGGGGYAAHTITAAAGTVCTYTSGVGGAGGTGSNPANVSAENGAAGGNSTFTVSSTTYTVNGGGGGKGSNGTGVAAGGAGGSGGAYTVSSPGGAGGTATRAPGAGGGSGGSADGAGIAGGNSAHDTPGSGGRGSGGYGGDGGQYTPGGVNPTSGGSPGGGGGGGAGIYTATYWTAQDGEPGGNGYHRITYAVPAGTTPQLNASLSAAATTDPYGNDINAGINAYGPDGGVVEITVQSDGTPQIFLGAPNRSAGGYTAQMHSTTNSPGAAAEFNEFLMYSGAPPGTDGTYLEMASSQKGNPSTGTIADVSIGIYGASGTNSEIIQFNAQRVLVSPPLTAWQPGTSNYETWHNFNPLNNGYSASSQGQYAQYKLYPDNTVGLRANITVAAGSAPGVTGAADINATALPVGYRPTAKRYAALGGPYGGLTASGSTDYSITPYVYLNTNGAIGVGGIASASGVGSQNIYFEVRFALD